MKITILNGEMSHGQTALSQYLQQLEEKLQLVSYVEMFTLSTMDLYYCIGCWDCWWKTPGKCVFKDDGEKIFKSVITSDLVIFASPLIAGFTTSMLKKITDRLIVLLHPYIEIRNKECHHKKRYEKYPDLGLILQREGDTDEEDLKIVKDIYMRIALNFHGELKFMKTTDIDNVEETAYEISTF